MAAASKPVAREKAAAAAVAAEAAAAAAAAVPAPKLPLSAWVNPQKLAAGRYLRGGAWVGVGGEDGVSAGRVVCRVFLKLWDVGYSWLQDPKSFVFLATHLATVPSRTFILATKTKVLPNTDIDVL